MLRLKTFGDDTTAILAYKCDNEITGWLNDTWASNSNARAAQHDPSLQIDTPAPCHLSALPVCEFTVVKPDVVEHHESHMRIEHWAQRQPDLKVRRNTLFLHTCKLYRSVPYWLSHIMVGNASPIQLGQPVRDSEPEDQIWTNPHPQLHWQLHVSAPKVLAAGQQQPARTSAVL